MQSTLQTLTSLQDALREALAKQDWSTITALDAQCRALIEEAEGCYHALREPLEELSQLYAELRQAAGVERERIAGELTRINKSKRAGQMYKAFG